MIDLDSGKRKGSWRLYMVEVTLPCVYVQGKVPNPLHTWGPSTHQSLNPTTTNTQHRVSWLNDQYIPKGLLTYFDISWHISRPHASHSLPRRHRRLPDASHNGVMLEYFDIFPHPLVTSRDDFCVTAGYAKNTWKYATPKMDIYVYVYVYIYIYIDVGAVKIPVITGNYTINYIFTGSCRPYAPKVTKDRLWVLIHLWVGTTSGRKLQQACSPYLLCLPCKMFTKKLRARSVIVNHVNQKHNIWEEESSC